MSGEVQQGIHTLKFGHAAYFHGMGHSGYDDNISDDSG
jgi:hypothetical protein